MEIFVDANSTSSIKDAIEIAESSYYKDEGGNEYYFQSDTPNTLTKYYENDEIESEEYLFSHVEKDVTPSNTKAVVFETMS